MYSIASWVAQPVQALDGVVEVEAPVVRFMLASAAEMPPCAATVCERVGNTLLVMQAVFRPFCAGAERSRAGHKPPGDHVIATRTCS